MIQKLSDKLLVILYESHNKYKQDTINKIKNIFLSIDKENFENCINSFRVTINNLPASEKELFEDAVYLFKNNTKY